jgi:hypothetical protein
MKRDRQAGQPGTYYKGLLDDRGADMNSTVRGTGTPLFHQLPERKRLDYSGMVSFLREHPELWNKDHGKIKAALVEAKFCSQDTDVVSIDIKGLLATVRR